MLTFRSALGPLLLMVAFLLLAGACSSGDDDNDAADDQTDDDADDDAEDDNDDDVDDDSADDDSADDDTADDDADDDTALPQTIEIDAGDMTVHIQIDPYQMEIVGPEEQTLLSTPAANPAGRGLNVSPMPFRAHAFQVGGDLGDWYCAVRVADYVQNGDQTDVTVIAEPVSGEGGAKNLVLSFRKLADDHLEFIATVPNEEDLTYQTGVYDLEDDEHFFGLGMQHNTIDSRGFLRTVFIGLGMDLSDQIQNHAPMPFYISSRGYGLFVEEKGHGYFDMGDGSNQAYGYKYRTTELKTHIFWGPDPLRVIELYTGETGRPPMNPDYLFGYLHWRNVNNSESEVYADADALREHGIPTSSIMVDAPWQTCYSTFEFAACPSGCQFVDPQAVIDYVHDQGYAFYLWTAEFVNKTCTIEVPGMIEDNSAQFDFAKESGYLVSILGFLWEYPWWHDNGAMVNFLNPDAYTWYQDLARNVMEMGVQGFKMDGGEYIGADTIGLWPAGAFGLGGYGDPNTAMHDYKFNYHQLFWELAQEYNQTEDGQNLGISSVRTAYWGEQVHINYFWPGDMESDWNFELGLPADIVQGLTIGTAGFPYYGSNDGGFSSYGTDDPELFARWTEASAFRPVFEGPRNGTADIWEAYPDWIEPLFRKFAVIHTRLFPYLKAYALKATQTGHPIMRMLPLHFMDDPDTYGRDFDYLLGEWLLVAPVYEQGATTREVYFPTGRWVNYWDNTVHDGAAFYDQAAPQDYIPVYARAGAIIPLLDASVETLWPTDNPEVIDHIDMADVLWIEVYPFGSSSFELVDGTSFAMSQDTGGFSVMISGSPATRVYSLRAVPATYGGGEPTGVVGPSGALTEYGTYDDWNAAAAGWFYDNATGNLWLRDEVSAGTFTVTE